MNIFKGVLAASILCLSMPGFGQITSTRLQDFYDDFASKKMMAGTTIESYEGSPYLNDEFTPGKVILSNGNEYKDILLRYNIYYDQFEFKKDGEELVLEKGEYYSCFIIGDEYFIYSEYISGNKKIDGYLRRFIDGEYSLYIKYSALLREAEKPGPYKLARKAMFIPKKPIFLVGRVGEAVYEINDSKDLLNCFSDISDVIMAYYNNKPKLKNEEDYISLVEFLNSIND